LNVASAKLENNKYQNKSKMCVFRKQRGKPNALLLFKTTLFKILG